MLSPGRAPQAEHGAPAAAAAAQSPELMEEGITESGLPPLPRGGIAKPAAFDLDENFDKPMA